jgi:hypothetical protein
MMIDRVALRHKHITLSRLEKYVTYRHRTCLCISNISVTPSIEAFTMYYHAFVRINIVL